MRLFLVMLALLFGASPAFAQWLRNPGPVKPAPKAATHRHHGVHKRAAKPRHTTRKAAIPAVKPQPDPRKAVRATAAKNVTKKVTKKVPLPTPAPQPKKTAKTSPAKSDVAKKAPVESGVFAGIPPAQRLKIRSALYWHGDYPKNEKGKDRTEAAIRSFQKRNRARVTGVLTDDQRKDLIEADDRYRKRYGWRVVLDPATGIRIGLPTKLVPDAYEAPYGTRWSSPHGTVKVETFRIRGPNADLAKLYKEARTHPASRRVETGVLRDDGFFISGMQGLKDFAVRAKLRDGEVRGFTILYDQMMETIVSPVMVAMASAFSPFPERPVPFASLSKRVEYGTGLIVSGRGDIVTARKVVHGCNVIVADGLGNAERVAEDAGDGLALLRVYGTAGLPALALPRAAPKPGDVTLIGIPDPKEVDGLKQLIEIKARVTGTHAIVPRQPEPLAGFAGAAALDGKGNFVGMMETRNYELASMQPSVPPVRLVGAAAIRDFLDRHHVTADGKAGVRQAAVRVICVRK